MKYQIEPTHFHPMSREPIWDAKAVEKLCAEIDELQAYLRTIAQFGGTLQQAKNLASKALQP